MWTRRGMYSVVCAMMMACGFSVTNCNWSDRCGQGDFSIIHCACCIWILDSTHKWFISKFHDSILYDLSLSHVYDDGKVDDGLQDARPGSDALHLSGNSWDEQWWGKVIVRKNIRGESNDDETWMFFIKGLGKRVKPKKGKNKQWDVKSMKMMV